MDRRGQRPADGATDRGGRSPDAGQEPGHPRTTGRLPDGHEAPATGATGRRRTDRLDAGHDEGVGTPARHRVELLRGTKGLLIMREVQRHTYRSGAPVRTVSP